MHVKTMTLKNIFKIFRTQKAGNIQMYWPWKQLLHFQKWVHHANWLLERVDLVFHTYWKFD